MQSDSPEIDAAREAAAVLKLRLKKTRYEAEAARLAALATEIEILLKASETQAEPKDWTAPDCYLGWEPYIAAAQARLASESSYTASDRAERDNGVLPSGVSSDETCLLPSTDVPARPDQAATVDVDEADSQDEEATDSGAASALLAADAKTADPAPLTDSLDVELTAVAGERKKRLRKQVPAWLVSVGAHLAIVLLLMLITFQTSTPGDAIALAATRAAEEVPALEAMAFETVESPATTAAAESAAPVVVNDLGETPTEAVSLVDPLAGQGRGAEATLEKFATGMAASPAMVGGGAADGESSTIFFGIEGGGNNFCYIVDSSQSMSDGRFEAARNELLRSIEALPVEKRFYVIFYDSNLDPMRFDARGEREPYPVPATAVNKAALRRWAMTVGLERGAPPDDALELALELEPDVIFLLTDGEFPERIETLLADKNRIESLFGDGGPRAIIHTIGFHSRAGEARLKRIAKTNGGRYQYIAGSP